MNLFELKNVVPFEGLLFKDLEISFNNTTFISGESGSGKSTLLKLLNGTISPTQGEIFYCKQNISCYEPTFLRKEVLLAGQNSYLFDGTIQENFEKFHNYREEKEPIPLQKIKKFLSLCSIPISPSSLCQSLSGGERQRVFIAICLSFSPKVLLLDEPTSALDDKNANTLIENLSTHCKGNGQSLIIVSHHKELIKKFADFEIQLSKENLQ